MAILKVTLLGDIRVTHNNWLTETKLTREIQSLLAYLLLQRHRAHRREVLASVFWAEHNQEKAQRALNTALWRLKRALEPDGVPAGTYLLSAHASEVSFNCHSEYWLDVEVFEQRAKSLIEDLPYTANEASIESLEKILELYKGELLEGFYDEWALQERERLRAIYLRSLMYLMHNYKLQKSYEKASAYGHQILNLDPIREDVHRELMRIYLESGQRALAARQYSICQLTLAKELGISPMEETQTLYAEVFPEVQKSHSPVAYAEPRNFEQALVQLQQVSYTIDLAKKQLQQTVRFFTKYTSSEDEKISVSRPSNG